MEGVSEPAFYVEDFQLVQHCLGGDENSARLLLREYHEQLVSVAVARGLPPAEAEDTVNQLWAEAVHREGGRPGRLAGYNGTCLLSTYLNTVVFNLWMTEHRKRERHAAILTGPNQPGPESGAAGTGASRDGFSAGDAPLIALLNSAIEAGARRCSPEQFVLIQLYHFDRLRGSELASMFDCDQSWVSRVRTRGEEVWREGIEEYLREHEPMLTLRWEDFLELCSVAAPHCLGVAS